ncbi:MAG TPA: tripartite tricarboxylate transporter substrate binding protein [Thermodesulfobacteriota bacterium]|nr:tripartite tricarboxylate transporter substrate binding protein [Thermodesulfobacteriota bacterium]
MVGVMKKWRWMWMALMVFLAFPAGSASPQNFPKGPINYLNPFNPGGEVDIAARAMQPDLEKNLGVPLVINYLPGAGGALCWSKLAAAKPDGYTIGGFSIPHIILQPMFMKDLSFKTDDFVILSIVEYTPIGLGVKKDFKVNTFKEFVDYCKANQGKVSCGGVGKFTGHHFATLQFMKLAGVKVNYVTFTGTSQVQTALMGGHIDAAFTNSSLLVTSKDQIKVLAIGSPKRMTQIPDVPTFEEMGYKMYPRIARGAMGPKAIPKDIQKRLEKAFSETTSKLDFKAKMEQAGFVPQVMGIEESQKYLDTEIKEHNRLIQEFDLKKQ